MSPATRGSMAGATMMRHAVLTAALAGVLGLIATTALAATPFAPVLKESPPAPGSQEAKVAALMAKLGPPRVRRVPTVQEVEVPAYPGAKIETNAGRLAQGNGTYIHLPQLVLLSADPPRKVAAYYRQRLGSWEVDKDTTVIGGRDEWVFVGPWIDMNDGSQEHDMVTIDTAGDVDRGRYLPDAKTRIEIDYVPPAMARAPNPDRVDFPPYVR